jgi:hypothetical protein
MLGERFSNRDQARAIRFNFEDFRARRVSVAIEKLNDVANSEAADTAQMPGLVGSET